MGSRDCADATWQRKYKHKIRLKAIELRLDIQNPLKMEETISDTCLLNMVGVNFKQNTSLRDRYHEYLQSSPLTCSSSLLLSTPSCLVAKVASNADSLSVLASLSTRHGFTRCSGRMFAMTHLSESHSAFLAQLETYLLSNTVVRTHAHPPSLSSKILDYIDASSTLAERGVSSSPTQFCTLLVAVSLDDEKVGWGIFTLDQYRDTIARPGDGDPLPDFELNFNRAELKLAEAFQLLTPAEENFVFPKLRSTSVPGSKKISLSKLLAVDVGAAPGGWTGYLATLTKSRTSIVAIDPAELEEGVADRPNVVHLKHKAQDVAGGMLDQAASRLVGQNWRESYRLLVCDANLDVRNTLKELVLPLTGDLLPGGLLILTLKLKRRTGVEGVQRKVEQARELLEEAGFASESIRTVWLFGNSKNERTMFATKS